MNRSIALLVLLAACGGDDSSGGKPSDAHVAIDAPADAPPDMPADALLDAPPPPPGHYHYVVDSMTIPVNNTQAYSYGLDLDGNSTIDNQLGMVLGTLTSMGFDLQASFTTAVDRGTAISLIDLGAMSFTADPAATFAMFPGANPMPAACTSITDAVCRHHLTGSATFSIAPNATANTPLSGAFPAGLFSGAPGHFPIPFVLDPTAPVMLNVIGARAKITSVSAGGIMTARIAGAIPQSEIDGKIYPAMRAGLEASIVKDCNQLTSPPLCGCTASSTGQTMVALFDTNPADCHISAVEVSGNTLVMSLFAPDVTIDAQQALSFGYLATAVPAGFTAP